MASDSHAKRPIVVERRKEKGRKKTPRLTKTYDVKIIPATVGVVAETEEPPKKRVAASETIFAAFFSSPGAGRQKGGQNAYIEKGQGNGKSSCTYQARTLSKGAFGRRSDFSA